MNIKNLPFFSRILFLISFICFLAALNIYTQYKSVKSNFNQQFTEVVVITNDALINFGDDYLNFLDEGLTPDEYKKSVLILEARLKEVGKSLEALSPPDSQRKLFDKFKSGYTLVYGVIEDNVEYLTSENPDAELPEKGQEKMSVGLQQIHEVKEMLIKEGSIKI